MDYGLWIIALSLVGLNPEPIGGAGSGTFDRTRVRHPKGPGN
jgi:hypothetical protein